MAEDQTTADYGSRPFADGGSGEGEYARPRRPTPETVTYLDGLPLDESIAAEQAREYIAYFQNKNDDADAEAPEYPPMLSATHAALSSIFHEFASLAAEENPSQQIETLVRISCRYSIIAKRIVLASLSSYWVFLSTHRFGSHVLQTVLRCVVAECEVNLDEFDDGQEQCEGKMVIEDSYETLLKSEDGSEGAVPSSLSKLLIQSVEELKQFAPELADHICGSHVLRTSLCILSGVELVDAFAPPGSTKQNNGKGEWETGTLAAARRGKFKDKKKKKKKKRFNAADEDSGGSTQEVTVIKAMKVIPELQSTDFNKDADALLTEMVGVISLTKEGNEGKVLPPGDLQSMTCHPSAGPLLVLILRLLSYRDFHSQKATKKNTDEKEVVPDRRLVILPQEPRYSHGSQAELFVHRLVSWDASISKADGKEANAKQPFASDIVYGLSGEPRGSILLETIFRCCPDSFHEELCRIGGFYDEATLRDYIRHGVSNFVVQVVLMTVRNKEQASKIVKCLSGIVEDGSILKVETITPKNDEDNEDEADDENKGKPHIHRMGVVWRAFEMCATKGSSQDQEKMLSALSRGFASFVTTPNDGSAESEKSNDKKRKKRSKAKGLSAEECIPHLLGLAPGTYEGEGDPTWGNWLTLDAAGARTLYHIIRFKERLRTEWVKGIIHIYGREDLVKIANDGLGSVCILDGLLDGPSRSTASKLLVAKLNDRIAFLAAERVGHHTVEKLFRALPTMEDKAALSAELSQNLNRLGSNAMGRSVMLSCAVKEYLEGESAWKDALAKQRERGNWLEEILGEKEGSGDEEDEIKTKKQKKDKKKKRKRKD